jgi:hypothetical protein
MFPVGGVEIMLLLIGAAAAVCGVLAMALRPRVGALTGWSIAGFLWVICTLAVLTLIPAHGAPGVVPAESRLSTCSWDIGGPAPDGFWIDGGGQRTLTAAVFVPAGVLLVLAVARWRAAWVLVPRGFLCLVGFSIAIEATQLALARIDRACDVTDVIDNATGAAIGVGIGIVLALVLRPWRARD